MTVKMKIQSGPLGDFFWNDGSGRVVTIGWRLSSSVVLSFGWFPWSPTLSVDYMQRIFKHCFFKFSMIFNLLICGRDLFLLSEIMLNNSLTGFKHWNTLTLKPHLIWAASTDFCRCWIYLKINSKICIYIVEWNHAIVLLNNLRTLNVKYTYLYLFCFVYWYGYNMIWPPQ